MPHAIRFHKTGGPEVLVWEEVQFWSGRKSGLASRGRGRRASATLPWA